ncbi:MAG: hypothetical protein R2703_06840 [Micropruina glycogenica]
MRASKKGTRRHRGVRRGSRVTISVVREPVLIILNGRVVGGSAAN